MNPSENRPDLIASQLGWNPGFFPVLLACIVGGFLGGAIVLQTHPFFAYEELPPLDFGSPPELVKQHHDAETVYRTQNYATEFAIIGLAFGICIGAFTGGNRFLLCAIGGGCVGALTGMGLGYASGLYITQKLLVNAEQTLQASMGLQTVVWGVVLANIVALVSVLKAGIVRVWMYWLVGLAAGFSVAVLQFVISSLMFPNANPIFLVPENASERAYWLAVFPVTAGLVLALGLNKLTPQPSRKIASDLDTTRVS